VSDDGPGSHELGPIDSGPETRFEPPATTGWILFRA
jgi:hypothetical protein